MIGHSVGRECCLGICYIPWRLEVPFVEPLLSHSETSFIAVFHLEHDAAGEMDNVQFKVWVLPC